MQHGKTSGALADSPTAVLDDPAEAARGAVRLSPRPPVLVIAAFPEIFRTENADILDAAGALLLDVDEPWTSNSRDVQNWISRAYAAGKQVIATGTPEALNRAVGIRSRSVITIQKNGNYASLAGQRLADELSVRLEKMFERIPRRKPLGAKTDVQTAPPRSWPVSSEKRNLSPAYYQRVISVEEEKELDRVLDEYDR